MHSYVVTKRPHLLQWKPLNVIFGHITCSHNGVKTNCAHTKRLHSSCHFSTNSTQTNNSQSFPHQFLSSTLTPFMTLHHCVVVCSVSSKRHNHKTCMLCRADCISSRCIHYHNATRSCMRNINVVHARSSTSNDFQ